MRSLIIGGAIIQTSLRGIAAATILLLLAPALATAPDSSLSADMHVEHMLNRAAAGYVQDQLQMAQAHHLDNGAQHIPATVAHGSLNTPHSSSLSPQPSLPHL